MIREDGSLTAHGIKLLKCGGSMSRAGSVVLANEVQCLEEPCKMDISRCKKLL